MQARTGLAALAVLALTACTSTTPSDTATGNPSAPAYTAASTEATSEAGEQASAGEDCLFGVWRLDNQAWAVLLQEILDAEGEGSVRSVDGEVLFELESGGTFASTYSDWSITMEAGEGIAVINRDGTDTGTWTRSGNTVSVGESSTDSVVTGYVESDGSRIDMPTVDGTTTDAIQDFSYECNATTLEATTAEGTIVFDRA